MYIEMYITDGTVSKEILFFLMDTFFKTHYLSRLHDSFPNKLKKEKPLNLSY